MLYVYYIHHRGQRIERGLTLIGVLEMGGGGLEFKLLLPRETDF
jgi:hypothetical protein